ncbi:TPA: toll/interleukin-1 receptor domain-containing protein [Photobacterium damselae]
MIQFTTFDDLKSLNRNLATNSQVKLKAAYSKVNKDTFLSHSSKDAEYLPGVIELLENHGASVYCDLADERMPETPNPDTAKIVKGQIQESKKLVVFVTINSKDSKWVPWELGIGDASLTTSNVALLPVANDWYEQSWAQQEYLGIYRHIVFGSLQGEPKPVWMVYDYHTNTATKLSQWFGG